MPELFGTMPDATPVHRHRLENDTLRLHILEFGAAIQSLFAPDRDGAIANVVLGLTDLDAYRTLSPHFGAVPGRYAGRIGGGSFDLDGITYRLPQNDGENTLHGGPAGFGRRVWTATDYSTTHLDLALTSVDGDQGFPGELNVRLRYTLDGPALHLDFEATTSAPTVLNLTNHSYFNLAGEGSGTAVGHILEIPANEFLPIRSGSLPTGQFSTVTGTPFDFRRPTRIADRIHQADPQILLARGYDQTFLIPGAGWRPAAILHDPISGRRLTVSSTEPALQLYSANMLTGSLAGPSGRTYRQGDAVCLEAQHLPNSPNQPEFPSTVLRPGEVYRARTTFAFDLA